MKTSEELFKAWSNFIHQEKDLLSENELKNLQDVNFCRNHKFLGRYSIPVIRLKSLVDDDRDADGRFYRRFFLFDKYSISNDWYHSKTETNRKDFFTWFLNLCKQKNVYDKVPLIIKEEVENDDVDIVVQHEESSKSVVDRDLKKETPFSNGETEKRSALQTIFFGAPGTGKSYKINYNLFMDKDGKLLGKGLKEVSPNRKFRTTFHPDYDYAQFVGAYKPTMNGGKIEYSFVPQVFAKAYATAWKLLLSDAAEKDVYLVIEEINRGNCAQIFGDLFQLLDRKQGHSEYPIDVDSDLAKWLNTDSKFGLGYVWNEYRRKINEWSENGLDGRDDVFCKVALPPNLNILATMNTSDQSLFPMDSAFKRRFDWEYVPISFDGKDAANFQIEIDASLYSWQKFVEAVNEKILDLTESEDKQLGEFFIKPDKKDENNQLLVISEERFLGKVMFYLWNEVCKDEHKNRSFFRTKDDGYFTFQDLYKPEKKDLLNRFMAEIGKNST